MPQANPEDSELGLSLARRLHGSRRSPSAMTSATGAPLRSVTARPLANIPSTVTTALSSVETSELLGIEPSQTTEAVATAAATTNSGSSVVDPTASLSMRSFAVIVCNECLYLEFPGCDVHGVLYTERAPDDDGSPVAGSPRRPGAPPLTAAKFHAKCPKCTAATNNVRPFREGCRRCKAATTVHMWCSTLSEITQAHEAFPVGCEEMEHSALSCELCNSVVFPRARGSLTKRTAEHALTSSNGKALKVSNFQLSMPHVDGCPRKGMPSQTMPVQLTKSELKFVLERLEHCPLTPRIIGGPQYRKRPQQVITQQNHLHQIYLRLLTTLIRSFDPLSPNALDPLTKIVALFEQIKPIALFHEWSPPQVLSTVQPKPTRVEASSCLDEHHSADVVLQQSGDIWRPRGVDTPTITDHRPEARVEWIQFHFNPPVAMASVEVRWHVDLSPARYSVVVTCDDGTMDTVAVVIDGRTCHTVPFAQRSSVTCVRLVVYWDPTKGMACGLEAVTFFEAGVDTHRASNESVLYDLQHWLLLASTSTSEAVRDTALAGLQRLALASGSLCGLMQLSTALLLNTTPCQPSAKPAYDEQDWHRLDRLSPTAQDAAKPFLAQLARSVLEIMAENDSPQAGVNSLVEKHVLEQIVKTLKQPSEDDESTKRVVPSPVPRLPSPKSICPSTEGEQSESPLYPYVTMAACQDTFSDSITRRSQLGMVILMVVSELSAWQMKRMQKAEEFAGKREEELMQLEEPFSLEVRPRFWELSDRLLSHVLDPWVSSSSKPAPRSRSLTPLHVEEEFKSTGPEDLTFDREAKETLGIDLYDVLTISFEELGTALAGSGYLGSMQHNHKPTFTPDTMCVSLLQVITSNIRRLVLSRADPMDLGEEDAISGKTSSNASVASPALEPIVEKLEQLISLGTKRSDKFFALSLKAAAAVEVGMEAFYPSAQQRTQLLTSRMGTGSTLEVQVRWPVQERDQEDPRYERLILMLQFECIRMGLTHAIRGRWQFFMHLIIQVPVAVDTMDVLQRHFAPCIQQAGFASWQVVAGAQEVSINLQRHLHWNRVEKMSHDSGSGWIRVYPRDVALFDDVLGDVDLFLSEHDKRAAAKTTARP